MDKNTTFNQLLKLINRNEFNNLVKRYNGNKKNHKFTSWHHLVTLLSSQLSDNKSLREIESSLNILGTKKHHLGLPNDIKRSTLSDANNHRDYRIFAELSKCLMLSSNKKIRSEAKRAIRLLDSSPIQLLDKSRYGWSSDTDNVRIKGLKLHLEYDYEQSIPVRSEVSRANIADITAAQDWSLSKDKIYVFDRGYIDYNWWDKIISISSDFITRPVKQTKISLISSNTLSEDAKSYGIISDDIVTIGKQKTNLSNSGNRKKLRKELYKENKLYKRRLRKVVVSCPDKDKDLVLITNNLSLSSVEIAQLYKKRWSIELYFKWIKQKLKIKKFIGNSENAVKIQIYTALIAYLLVAMFKEMSVLNKCSMKQAFDIIRNLLMHQKYIDNSIHNTKNNYYIIDKKYEQTFFNFGH